MNRTLDRIPLNEFARHVTRIIDRVASERVTVVIEREGTPLVVLGPMRRAPKHRRRKSAADYRAFRAAAGSWRGVDTDRFFAESYSSRTRLTRPPVEL